MTVSWNGSQGYIFEDVRAQWKGTKLIIQFLAFKRSTVTVPARETWKRARAYMVGSSLNTSRRGYAEFVIARKDIRKWNERIRNKAAQYLVERNIIRAYDWN